MSSASSFQLTTDTFSPPIIDTFLLTLRVKPIFIPILTHLSSHTRGTTPPGSPLSELDDSINSLPGVRTILTPPPKKTAREAVDLYLNVQHNLAQQNADVLDKARTHIEHELPALRNHQDHWGADILLREQLKNKKDTLAKADKHGAGSKKQEGESSRASGNTSSMLLFQVNSEPANNVVLTSTPFRLTKHCLDRDATEAQESHPKWHAVAGPAQEAFDKLQMQKEDLVGNADHLEHCYLQLQNEFDKTQRLNEQYRKEKNDLIKEKSDLERLAELRANEYATLLKEKEKLEQLAEKLEYTVEQRDIEMLDLRETIEETDQANTVNMELQSDKVDRLTANVSHLQTLLETAQRERDVSRKHAETIAQEARSVATDMQAKEAALTEHETEIASLRNQIKKGKYKSRPTVNDDHDADDESPEPTPGASSSSTSIPSDNHSIRDLITDTLAQLMAANPSLHASPASSTPKRRKARNPHPNVGSVKANRELKQSELATLKPEDKAGWKSFLRQSFLKLTGQTHVSHFEKYNPVTTEIAKTV
ncbi:hypothetical protein BT96DRAFT_1005190 [Gymnopus androsaceus JB14]|uniref:Uncharacterized protein n=1 Tax=Gymnopus androsaceus JB14 TaxID=1447944 RepID=A0A6A4GQ81_9AGAR|nr:hypothetical protein BT96DRAFT_1005190 [Gymnopus androsaceus JB14]